MSLLAKIKAIKPDAKVVLMSAFEVSDLEFSMPGVKIDDFLRKPVDVKTLVRRVKVTMASSVAAYLLATDYEKHGMPTETQKQKPALRPLMAQRSW